MNKKNIGVIAAAVAIIGAAAWYLHGAGEPAKARGGAGAKGARGQPPTVVNVVKPQRQDVPVVLQSNGTVTPVSTVDLHPQTTSTIRTVHIKEGQFVKAGELMFSLDDRGDRANVDKAHAQIARDQAALADVERQYKRSQELVAQKFLAQSAVDTLRSQVEAARALLAADQAALRSTGVVGQLQRDPRADGRPGRRHQRLPGQPGAAGHLADHRSPSSIRSTSPSPCRKRRWATCWRRRSAARWRSRPAPARAGKAGHRHAQLHRQHGRPAGRHDPRQGAVRQPRQQPVAGPVRQHPRDGADAAGRDRDPAGGHHHQHPRHLRLRGRRRPVGAAGAGRAPARVRPERGGVRPDRRRAGDHRRQAEPAPGRQGARWRQARRRAESRTPPAWPRRMPSA